MLVLRQFFRHSAASEILQSNPAFQLCVFQNHLRSDKVYTTVRNSATESSSNDNGGEIIPASKSVSKAMKAYLQRAQEYENFRKKEILKYEIGKRHLANMMGEDPETFTQEDIDNAIEYLLPSGLFQKRAKPHMTHPLVLFPDKKAVEFDEAGRPFHHLFYTAFPLYFEVLQTISIKAKRMDLEADRILRQKEEFKKPLNLASTDWLPKQKLESLLKENLHDYHYLFFKSTMDRFLSHPCSYLEEEFIMKFRSYIDKSLEEIHEIPKLMYNEKGDPYMTATGKRRKASATVTVTGNGSGKIEVQGSDLLYFENLQDREQILFPLQFTNNLKKVDVKATVEGGNFAGQAGAIRYGISLALRSFVDEKMIDYMTLAGLLTLDRRHQARKVYGRKGARAKYTWKKR